MGEANMWVDSYGKMKQVGPETDQSQPVYIWILLHYLLVVWTWADDLALFPSSVKWEKNSMDFKELLGDWN